LTAPYTSKHAAGITSLDFGKFTLDIGKPVSELYLKDKYMEAYIFK
jgi:hypothetical protein